jgi:hypothetical protein
MAERRASVIVCDEILYAMTGKAFLQGVYQSDIMIPGQELTIQQLVFYFSAETPRDNPFKKIVLKVIPPGMPPSQVDVALPPTPNLTPDRNKMILRAPLLLQQPILRPGKIETIVVTESEELDAGGAWVVSVSPPLPT